LANEEYNPLFYSHTNKKGKGVHLLLHIVTNPLSLSRNKLIKLGILLLILATLDAVFTDFGIKGYHITEANPIMRRIYEGNLIGFYLIKIALPILLIGIVSKLEPRPFIVFSLYIAIFFYVTVLLLHFSWLTLTFIGM